MDSKTFERAKEIEKSVQDLELKNKLIKIHLKNLELWSDHINMEVDISLKGKIEINPEYVRNMLESQESENNTKIYKLKEQFKNL